jgi:RNA polymerase-binding transcription factor DksA
MSASDTAIRFRGASPLSPEQLEEFRRLLIDRRIDVGKSYQGLSDAACRTPGEASGQLSSIPSQAGELASETFEQEMSIEMMARVQDELNSIQEALDRIQARSFGVCEDCGGADSDRPAERHPMARFCIECQSRVEG